MNYYLNGNDAFRLKLWITPDAEEAKPTTNAVEA
jgi:hypothetical protein